jgi:hypothetical protein
MDDVATIFIHEMCRATMDRVITEVEKNASFSKLLEIAKANFGFDPSKKKKSRIDPSIPFYSYLKLD